MSRAPTRMSIETDVEWAELGTVPPGELTEARLLAHWAVQAIAPVSSQLVPAQPDYGHTALEWLADPMMLVTRRVDRGRPFRLGLQISDLTLALIDENDAVEQTFGLIGQTLDDGLKWVSARVEERLSAPLAEPLALVGYSMQGHPVKDGSAFSTPAVPGALAELERWYRNGFRMLESVRAVTPDASEVRTWPHHFDVATLATLDGPEVDAEQARSLGFGMSPGDDSYPEPYWYVLPWPPPPPERLDQLSAGHWHTEGFTGAVLTGAHDAATVRTYFDEAKRVGRAALG